jgi:hypothetical protein
MYYDKNQRGYRAAAMQDGILSQHSERKVGSVEFAQAHLQLPEPHANPLELRPLLAEVAQEVGISLFVTHAAADVAPNPFDVKRQEVGSVVLRLLIDERQDHSRTPRLEQFQGAAYLAAKKLHTSRPKFHQLAEGYAQAVLGMASGYEKDAPPLPATFYQQHAPPDGWHIQHGHIVYLGLLSTEVVPGTHFTPVFRGFDKYPGAKAAILTFQATERNVATLHEVANNLAKQYFYTIEGIRTHTGLRESVSYIGSAALREAKGQSTNALFSEADLQLVRHMFNLLGRQDETGVAIEAFWESGPYTEEEVRKAIDGLFRVEYVDLRTDFSGSYMARFSDSRMWNKCQTEGPDSLLNQLRLFNK